MEKRFNAASVKRISVLKLTLGLFFCVVRLYENRLTNHSVRIFISDILLSSVGSTFLEPIGAF